MAEFAAVDRLVSLEDRLEQLEKISAFNAAHPPIGLDNNNNDDAIRNYQSQMLERLKAIREALLAEGGDIAKIKAERDAAVLENATLKKENERLGYRVRHLVKALNEEELKHN